MKILNWFCIYFTNRGYKLFWWYEQNSKNVLILKQNQLNSVVTIFDVVIN